MFLYLLEIGRGDYDHLKSTQHLVVPFSEFSRKFVELLHMSSSQHGHSNSSNGSNGSNGGNGSNSSGNGNSTGSNGGKWSISLTPSSNLSIEETTTFRSITHLSLQFTQPTTLDLTSHLSSLVRQYKHRSEDLEVELRASKERYSVDLDVARSESARVSNELADLRSSTEHRESDLRRTLTAQFQLEKDRMEKDKVAIVKDGEIARMALVERHDAEMKSKSAQIDRLTSDLTEMTQWRRKNETVIDDLRDAISKMSRDMSDLRSTLRSLEEERGAMQKEKESYGMLIEGSRKQIVFLERSMADKQSYIARLEVSSQSHTVDLSKATEAVTQLKSQLSDAEAQLRSQLGDNAKANEIINKLQTEAKNVKAKLKLKSLLASQHEKLLDETKSTLETALKQLNDIQQDASSKEALIVSLKADVERLQVQTEKDRKVIEENNSVIEWLHRQLNDDSGAVRRPLSAIQHRASYQYDSGPANPVAPAPHANGKHPLSNVAMKYLPAAETNLQNHIPRAANLIKTHTAPQLDIKRPSTSGGAGEAAGSMPFKSNYFKV